MTRVVRRHHSKTTQSPPNEPVFGTSQEKAWLGNAAASIAILIFLSAVWVETDAYRIAGGTLLLVAMGHFLWRDSWFGLKTLIGWMGITCIIWAIYVAGRIFYVFFINQYLFIGSAEGIYIFPLVYPLLGYAFFLYIKRPFPIVLAFIIISFVSIGLSTDYYAIFNNQRASFSFHNNTIHASVCVGFIIICSLSFISYIATERELHSSIRNILITIAVVTFAIGIASLYALRSKGVWLSLAIALPLLVSLISIRNSSWTLRVTVQGLLALTVIGATIQISELWMVVGDTYNAAALLVAELATDTPHEAVNQAITDEFLPLGFRERLMLWENAVYIWSKYPIFGAGIAWEADKQMPYPAPYNYFHNGYLEVAVRYGIAGLAFYTILFAWSLREVWYAYRAGVIDGSAFQCYVACFVFFCLTILTNSNNRLAIGESYMWFAASFAFFCFFSLRASVQDSERRGDVL